MEHLGYCQQHVELRNGDATDCDREAVLLSDDGALFCADCLESSKLRRSEVKRVNDAGNESLKRLWLAQSQEAARRFVANPTDKHREDLRVCIDNLSMAHGTFRSSRKRVA